MGNVSTLASAPTGKLPAGSACSDVHMALCAVNLAECAEEKIPPSTLAEIHLTAAVGLRTRCGGRLGFLAVSSPRGADGLRVTRALVGPPVLRAVKQTEARRGAHQRSRACWCSEMRSARRDGDPYSKANKDSSAL